MIRQAGHDPRLHLFRRDFCRIYEGFQGEMIGSYAGRSGLVDANVQQGLLWPDPNPVQRKKR